MVATIALALALPAVAQSAPPTLGSVGQSARHLTATWTLPPGMENDYIEVATSPATYPDTGDFLIENVVMFDLLDVGSRSFFSTEQLPEGTYYVHVAAYDPLCNPALQACADEFSSPPAVITIVPDSPSPPPATPFAVNPILDRVTAFAALNAPVLQRVDKLYVLAKMFERGTLAARGTVNVPNVSNGSRVLRLKTVTRNAFPGTGVKLKLKLARTGVQAVKNALGRDRKVRARITVIAKDLAGNTKTEKRTVVLRP